MARTLHRRARAAFEEDGSSNGERHYVGNCGSHPRPTLLYDTYPGWIAYPEIVNKFAKRIHVIGGGLAGPEAALQAASLGCEVTLSEMRPLRSTEAHQTDDFAELVCSNSLKSETEHSAPWLLKQEIRRAGSLLLQAADASAVPAGHALAVDRAEFSRRVADLVAAQPNIEVRREEVTALHEDDPDTITILASGPLTSSPLAGELQRLTGADHLAFYDSISPIVDASTVDMDKVYFAARWDRGTADYINCPFTKEEYEIFLDALTTGLRV